MENLGQLQSDLFLAQRMARKYPSAEADAKVAEIEAAIAALSDDVPSEDPGTGKQATAKAPAEKKAKPAADTKKNKEKVTPPAQEQKPDEEPLTQSSTTSDESTATPASDQTSSQTPTQTSEPS